MDDITPGMRVYNREWNYNGTTVQRIGHTRWLVETEPNGVRVEAEAYHLERA
jgi:hypothetical protein